MEDTLSTVPWFIDGPDLNAPVQAMGTCYQDDSCVECSCDGDCGCDSDNGQD